MNIEISIEINNNDKIPKYFLYFPRCYKFCTYHPDF